MRHFSTIAVAILTVLVLTITPALAQNKFKNEDSAQNRQDNAFGTRQIEDEKPTTTFGTNEAGDSTISSDPPQKEETDWYDRETVITPWGVSSKPANSNSTTTTTEEFVDEDGKKTTRTTTTKTKKD
ncbi:hypothetical protein SYK_17520 [Pseudodesulfovibrio nedwellii]|uniref:Secreted protein n=1 Tax=Pseudodesulfovibrio nedwellii TaxID=2973072 RepID=A0ABM8B0S7_9BACT|nr:hypothetical protein [Pseudodesulfovibrio nedwellii]BDQ37392.1 hypothetical protein SYK_17520 [Pseudodesulfovibrio nedwellii]